MFRQAKILKQPAPRNGTIVAIVVVALLVVAMGIALVYDRYWLEIAQVEIRTATEAAALAAVAELATDDLLRETVNPQDRLEEARNIARVVAANNLVVGESLQLDVSPGGDLLFGQVIYSATTGERTFLETDSDPTTVIATGIRSRNRNNPVSLFLAGVTGEPVADMVETIEASIDNHIVGVRPYPKAAVPALPLAILASDPLGEREDTWQVQIEQDLGQDRYAYDPSTRKVVLGDDGIAEIVLISKRAESDENDFNVQLLNMGTQFDLASLERQISQGWSSNDLAPFGGELTPALNAYQIESLSIIPDTVLESLHTAVGQPRICLLYDQHQPEGRAGLGSVRCIGLVAGRVMAIQVIDSETTEIVFQPTVMATRSAMLATDKSADDNNIPPVVASHRYIYKIHRTQ